MTARDLALTGWQVRYEQRSFWRNRRAAFFSLLFPLMYLVVFGTLTHGQTLDTRDGLAMIDFYVPGIVTYAIVLIGFNATALAFAYRRTSGMFKRIRATPLPWSAYVAGTLGSTFLVIALSVAVMLIVGVALFGAHVQLDTLPALLVTLALGSACCTALGVAASRIVSKPESGASSRSSDETPAWRTIGARRTPRATSSVTSRVVNGRPALGISALPGCVAKIVW